MAALIVEPILGEGGYVVPPDDFLPALREIADRHGILLIVDEVQTGVGRTGHMWASEWSGLRPDILVMAKGIASGMPLSGIMARRDLLDRFSPGSHGGTYGGNAVACAAALATLDVIAAEGLLENARRQGERLLSNLRRLADEHATVAEVRGRGLMAGIEFARRRLAHPTARPGQGPDPGRIRAQAAAALVRDLWPGGAHHSAAGHDRYGSRLGHQHHLGVAGRHRRLSLRQPSGVGSAARRR